MVSLFVILIFIPATEHAFENLSRACWRPFWAETSSTRSFANNSCCTVQSPIFTAPQNLTFLTILSIQIRKNTDERYVPIIGAFSLVSFLAAKYYPTCLPLLWCLPSPACYLTNKSQPTKIIHVLCFQHFKSDIILCRCFDNCMHICFGYLNVFPNLFFVN